MADYSHLRVGDRVAYSDYTFRTAGTAEVAKVGRVWLDLRVASSGYRSEMRVRIVDGKSKDGRFSIRTLEEARESERRARAERVLREAGLSISFATTPRPTTDLLVELAAVVVKHQLIKE